MKKIVLSLSIGLVFSGTVFAQQTLLGKYSGSYTQTAHRGGGEVQRGLTLELVSVEGDVVKGRAFRSGGRKGTCDGEFPVEGTVKGNDLVLKSTESGGRVEDCRMTLRLTVEGNRLVGTLNQHKAQLSK